MVTSLMVLAFPCKAQRLKLSLDAGYAVSKRNERVFPGGIYKEHLHFKA